jgi:hypothetical protein
MSIDYDNLATAQDWIDAGREVVTDARDAAKTTDKNKWQSAADACAEFVDKRTLDCPKEIAHIVSGAQVELSQLIVADDIGSIKSRSAQFDAYLLDIDHLSAVAEKSADMISLKSATDAIADVTGVVKGLKDVKKELGKGDVDVDAAAKAIQNLIDRLVKVRDDVDALGNA